MKKNIRAYGGQINGAHVWHVLSEPWIYSLITIQYSCIKKKFKNKNKNTTRSWFMNDKLRWGLFNCMTFMGANYSLLLVGYMGGEIDLWVCSINIKSRYYVWSLESWVLIQLPFRGRRTVVLAAQKDRPRLVRLTRAVQCSAVQWVGWWWLLDYKFDNDSALWSTLLCVL